METKQAERVVISCSGYPIVESLNGHGINGDPSAKVEDLEGWANGVKNWWSNRFVYHLVFIGQFSERVRDRVENFDHYQNVKLSQLLQQRARYTVDLSLILDLSRQTTPNKWLSMYPFMR